MRLTGQRPLNPGRADSQTVLSQEIDDDIQEAIRLHEEGDLERSTKIFGQLAEPHGANNPLSQVLYGLALRHGWGCEPDPAGAVRYLSAAASNAASIEQLALQAGLKKGGAAKGELVLAIFELANCFRHGWGIPKDAYAAKQYYETAANLGDTDAMNEVGWCYLEGFGCKKDKFASARYYRLAEKAGNKTLGNSWYVVSPGHWGASSQRLRPNWLHTLHCLQYIHLLYPRPVVRTRSGKISTTRRARTVRRSSAIVHMSMDLMDMGIWPTHAVPWYGRATGGKKGLSLIAVRTRTTTGQAHFACSWSFRENVLVNGAGL
ncbi:hypothetical protein G7046_g8588 [Stylonectria norvegica]|nr:hypothetical protein G7046_g8588 [Stylonectria norvegica]